MERGPLAHGMAGWFGQNGVPIEVSQFLVGRAVPERGLDVHRDFREKTGSDLADCGEPEPVAGAAETVAYGADEADHALRALDPEIGRASCRERV